MRALKAAGAQSALSESQKSEVAPVLEALDCLRVAITIFDADEKLIYANSHFYYLFRSLPAQLLGHSYEDLIRLEISGGEINEPRILADKDRFIAERRIQLQDGEYAPRDILLSDGRFIEIKARRTPSGCAILLWSDVTAARHQYTRLEDAIGMSADAFAFFDSHDRFVLGNDEYAKLASVPNATQLQGQSFTEIVTRAVKDGPFPIEENFDDWMKRRLEGHRSPAAAYTLTSREGTSYLVRDRATSDGGRAVVFTDVTDKKRVEAALAEQTKTLDQTRNALAQSETEAQKQATYLADLTTRLDAVASEADTTKTTLLRTMSHELKTPLNAILGFSDLMNSMAERLGPDQVREYSSLIHQGGTNLLRLLNQIMDLSKMAAGRYELCRAAIDAGSVLWLACEAIQAKALARHVRIDASECPVGILIDADESAFVAMVNHLLENAVNFTQEGALIRLAVKRGADRVHISVSDNGPGVSEADMRRILEPFEQAGRGTTDHAAGAGLGLTLV
ncbi:MAG TPA: PAS-domain containing protein, partial [Rhizomicrobium sp.]